MTTQKVTQPKYLKFITNNPGMSESQINRVLYGFSRSDKFANNKKYAECLRRLLRSGAINRKQVQIYPTGIYVYKYYANVTMEEFLRTYRKPKVVKFKKSC